MADEVLRNEKTEEGRKIWAEIDSAAARAPQWLIDRAKETAENRAIQKEQAGEG